VPRSSRRAFDGEYSLSITRSAVEEFGQWLPA
jgi:hypothetical protein